MSGEQAYSLATEARPIDPHIKENIDTLNLKVQNYLDAKAAQDKKAIAKASKDLILLMSPYFDKYAQILSGSNMDLANNDTRLFIGMFYPGQFITQSKLSVLRENFTKFYTSNYTDKDDLKNDLICLFLDKVLSKFTKKEGIDSLLYLTKLFRYRLKDLYNSRMFKDAINPSNESIDNFSDILSIDSVGSELDQKWLLNPRTKYGRMFTPEERYIIWLALWKKVSLNKLSAFIGIQRKYILALLGRVKDMANSG